MAAGGPLQAPELHRLGTLLRRPSSVTGNRFFVETSSDLQQAAPTDAILRGIVRKSIIEENGQTPICWGDWSLFF